MDKQNARPVRLFLGLALLVSLAVIGGCQSSSNSTDASTVLTITAQPTTLATGATAVIEATLTANDEPVQGEAITFSVSPTGSGAFSSLVDTTDVDGTVTTIFTPSTSGTITLMATLDQTTFAQATLTVNGGGQQGTGNIEIGLDKSSLFANGEDTAQVTVTVRDGDGGLASDGISVVLTAGERFLDNDENGLWSLGDSLLVDINGNDSWDGIGTIASNVQTSGGTGQAMTEYISGNQAGTIYIRATVTSPAAYAGYAEFMVTLSPNTSVRNVFLASDSLNLVVSGTGGIETGMLRATCYDMFGNPVSEGIPVNFAIIDGPDGGEQLGDQGWGPYASITNALGTANCPLSSGTSSGTIRIRAWAVTATDSAISNAAQVLVASGPPHYIVVGSEECNVPYWNKVGFTNNIVAVVSDKYKNPVIDSTVVYFTTDEGTMKAYEARTINHEGIASTKWISGTQLPDSADGDVLIIAETSGGTVIDSSYFINSHVPDTLICIGVPATIPADGNTEVKINVLGRDLNNNYVVDGTAFDGDATYLSVGGGALSDGCYSSFTRVSIKSVTLQLDYSLSGGTDDGIGAVDVLSYWYGGTAASAFTIQLLTGTAYSGTSTLSGPGAASPGEVLSYFVVIRDRWGNPLGDHSLTMTATVGSVSGATQVTNAYGEAYGFSYTAPGTDGDYTLTVTDNDPRGGIVLTTTISVSST